MAVEEERGVPIPIHQPSLLMSLLGTRGCRLVNVLNSVLQGHLPVCWRLYQLCTLGDRHGLARPRVTSVPTTPNTGSDMRLPPVSGLKASGWLPLLLAPACCGMGHMEGTQRGTRRDSGVPMAS